MPLLFSDKIYCLRLANGHVWQLMATKDAEDWLDKLAPIMHLRNCRQNGHPKLIFTKEKLDNDSIYALEPSIHRILPRYGWKSSNHYVKKPDLDFQFWYHNDIPDAIIYIGKKEESDEDKRHKTEVLSMWSSSFLIYRREQYFGGFPLHAGLVEKDGKGILLAGRSGMGKSTCCRRIPSPWNALSDDQTLIVRDENGQYMVHPFPTWSEYLWKLSKKTWDVETYVPLHALFFVEKSENDEVLPTPIEKGKSAMMISNSMMQISMTSLLELDKEEQVLLRKKTFDYACELARSIPAYILRVSLHGQFWKEIEKVI